jgi:hypothetical protein
MKTLPKILLTGSVLSFAAGLTGPGIELWFGILKPLGVLMFVRLLLCMSFRTSTRSSMRPTRSCGTNCCNSPSRLNRFYFRPWPRWLREHRSKDHGKDWLGSSGSRRPRQETADGRERPRGPVSNQRNSSPDRFLGLLQEGVALCDSFCKSARSQGDLAQCRARTFSHWTHRQC